MDYKKGLVFLFILFLLTACSIKTQHEVKPIELKIDAHITIDIRHVEKEADSILDEISGGEESSISKLLKYASSISFMPEVWAAGDGKKEATQRIKKRRPSISEYKKKGLVGENNMGLIEIVSKRNITNKIKKDVEAENKDWMIIYKTIAKAELKGAPLTDKAIKKVQKVFAKKKQERAAKGEWIQKESGKWVKK
jgi:uncharacterized protein YdbL (DUF1318 family)